MTKNLTNRAVFIFRVVATIAAFSGTLLSSVQAQALVRYHDTKTISRKVAPTPAPQPAPNDLVGFWLFQSGDQNKGAQMVLALEADGTYEQVVVIFEGGQRKNIHEKGRWYADTKQLATRSDNNEESLYNYQVTANELVLEFLLDGQMARLEFHRIDPNQAQQTPQSNPPSLEVNQQQHRGPSIVGTWHCHGVLEGNEIYIRATFAANGSLQIEMLIGTPEGQVNVSSRGTWAIQGNVLEMKTESGNERVPFEFRGDSLFLDYSVVGFTLEMVRVTN